MTTRSPEVQEDLIQQCIDIAHEMMTDPYYLDEEDELAKDADAAGGKSGDGPGYGSLAPEEVERRKNNKMRKGWWTPFALNIENLLNFTVGFNPDLKRILKQEKMEILGRFMIDMSQGDKRVKRADVEQLEDLGRRVVAAVETTRAKK